MVDNENKSELPPDMMDAVDRRINEALERGGRAPTGQASPMEQEFLALLKKTNDGIRHLEERLDEKIDSRTGDSPQMKQMMTDYRAMVDQMTNLGQSIQRLEGKMDTLSKDVEGQASRLEGLESGQTAKPGRPTRAQKGKADLPPLKKPAPPKPKPDPLPEKQQKAESEPPRKPKPKPKPAPKAGGPPPAPDYHPEAQRGMIGPQKPAPEPEPEPEVEPEQAAAPPPPTSKKAPPPAASESKAAKSQKKHDPVDPIGKHPLHHEDRELGVQGKPIPVVPLLISIVVILFLGWYAFKERLFNRTLLDEVAQQEQVAADLTALQDCPAGSLDQELRAVRMAADTERYFAGVKTPAALLAILGIDDWTFRSELVHLEKRVTGYMETLKAHNGPTFTIDLGEVEVRKQRSFELKTHYNNQVPWLREIASGDNDRVSAQTVFYLWLQIATNAKDKDGMWGEGTQKAVASYINDAGTVNLIADADGLNGPELLARFMRENPGLSPLDVSFENTVINAFDLTRSAYESQLNGLAVAISQGRYGLETPFLKIEQTIGGQRYLIYAEFCRNGSPMALEQWNRTFAPAPETATHEGPPEVEIAPDQAVFRVWLAARLGLIRSGGDAGSVLDVLTTLEGQTATSIAAACKQ